MRVGALFSGGKDSTYAAWLASKKDELRCLITIFPKSELSFMFHYPNIEWTSLQAEAAGIPHSTDKTEGIKELELEDLTHTISNAAKDYDLEGLYTGALASVYQRSRVEKICSELDLKCVSPLWGVDPEGHLRRLLKDGFSTMVVSVSALGLDESWLGRILDSAAVDELVNLAKKYRFHAGLEGGEGETFILDCPLFKRRVEIQESTKQWNGDSGQLKISKARLLPKD